MGDPYPNFSDIFRTGDSQATNEQAFDPQPADFQYSPTWTSPADYSTQMQASPYCNNDKNITNQPQFQDLNMYNNHLDHAWDTATATWYSRLTADDKRTIWDQVPHLSLKERESIELYKIDPVRLFCRTVALRDLNNPNPEASQPQHMTVSPQQLTCVQEWPETQISTPVPQQTGCSQEYPVVIEEGAVPAATIPQSVPSQKPKYVDVTNLMHVYSDIPEEGDFVYHAFCAMRRMVQFGTIFQFNRLARSHTWFVCEGDPKIYHCIRKNDGARKCAWELDQELSRLEKALEESNERDEQEIKQRNAKRKKAAADNAARKREETMRKKADREQKKRKRADHKANAPRRSKRKTSDCDTDNTAKLPRKKSRLNTNEEEAEDIETPPADRREAMNDKASNALVEEMGVGTESASADCEELDSDDEALAASCTKLLEQ